MRVLETMERCSRQSDRQCTIVLEVVKGGEVAECGICFVSGLRRDGGVGREERRNNGGRGGRGTYRHLIFCKFSTGN